MLSGRLELRRTGIGAASALILIATFPPDRNCGSGSSAADACACRPRTRAPAAASGLAGPVSECRRPEGPPGRPASPAGTAASWDSILPSEITPCAFGSGKFGTPWERMHAARGPCESCPVMLNGPPPPICCVSFRVEGAAPARGRRAGRARARCRRARTQARDRRVRTRRRNRQRVARRLPARGTRAAIPVRLISEIPSVSRCTSITPLSVRDDELTSQD